MKQIDLAKFKLEPPASISFSGGRTSGFMLWHILQAHGGKLPDDVHVLFANTGKEMPETLDFVHACAEAWDVNVRWLEYANVPGKMQEVTYETASRDGTPFATMLENRHYYLPNPVHRLCTHHLKVGLFLRFMKNLGHKEWDSAIGLRKDEPRRVARVLGREDEYQTMLAPLYSAGVTKKDVLDWWRTHAFDLTLPDSGGKTLAGNCDLCFLKSTHQLLMMLNEKPELADWWIEMEERSTKAYKAKGLRLTTGVLFRKDRPSYRQLRDMAVKSKPLRFSTNNDDFTSSCFCGD